MKQELMDRDDIFGDIFERVDGCEEVVEEWLVWCWQDVGMVVVFIILYWFKWSVYEIECEVVWKVQLCLDDGMR